MQAIWSRVGQTPFCRCRTCINTANGLVRRSSNAVGRRKPTFADVFTACYTSILGTAAVLDARNKDDRRRKLDKELEDARAALATYNVKEKPTQKSPKTSYQDLNSHLYPSKTDKTRSEDVLETLCAVITAPINVQLASQRLKSRGHEVENLWHEFQLGPLRDDGTIESRKDERRLWSRIKFDEEYDTRPLSTCSPRTQPQLRQLEDRTRELINRLLEQCGSPDSNIPDDKLYQDIKQMNARSFPHYEHPLDRETDARKSRLELNKSLRTVFKTYPATERRAMVGTICYNLLASEFPPNIHTYNTLVYGFNRRRQPDLAQAVLDMLASDKTLRPTQQTMICLLNHYITTGNVLGFYHHIARMIGKSTVGIGLQKKHVELLPNNRNVQEWVKETSVARFGDLLVETAKFSGNILETIMRGFLHFNLLRQAVTVFILCLRQNINFGNTRIVSQLFDQCIYALNAPLASALIRALAEHLHVVARLISTDPASRIAGQINNLLDICRLRNSVHLVTREERERLGFHPGKLDDLASQLWISDLERHIAQISTITSSIHQALVAKRRLCERISTAWEAALHYQTTAPMLSPVAAQRSWKIRVVVAAKQVADTERLLRSYQMGFRSILATTMSQDDRAVLYNQDVPFSTQVQNYFHLRNNRLASFHAQRAIDVSTSKANSRERRRGQGSTGYQEFHGFMTKLWLGQLNRRALVGKQRLEREYRNDRDMSYHTSGARLSYRQRLRVCFEVQRQSSEKESKGKRPEPSILQPSTLNKDEARLMDFTKAAPSLFGAHEEHLPRADLQAAAG
jgi:hypothetical protein